MPRPLLFAMLMCFALVPTSRLRAAASHPLTIVCFGDSLTAGYGSPQGQSYPDYLESYLIEQGQPQHIVNAGIDGNTTKDGVERLRSVLALHPDIVILELGGNDGLRGAPVSIITANLTTIVETLQKNHVRILLAGVYMPPNYGPDYVSQFDAMYTQLAHKYKLPLLPFILKDAYGAPGMMNADNVHPTSPGYRIVARNVLAVLLPMLKK